MGNHKAAIKVVSPANKRKLDIIVVGTGLGGASAAASLGELGYNVKVFCIQDSPRRAHSIAAQGGINAARRTTATTTIRSTGCSTIRSKAATTAPVKPMFTAWPKFRTASSTACVGQGVPFAREYGGMLDNRSFGGAQVSRTFYARGQTGQQLLLVYAALNKEIAAGSVKSYPRHEMPDIVIEDGEARGIIARNLGDGRIGVSAHTP